MTLTLKPIHEAWGNRQDRVLSVHCLAAVEHHRKGTLSAQFVDTIAAMPAHTVEGVTLKLRLLRRLYGGTAAGLPRDAPPEAVLAFSLLRDVAQRRAVA